jgi:hypothetical protein
MMVMVTVFVDGDDGAAGDAEPPSLHDTEQMTTVDAAACTSRRRIPMLPFSR